jgi:hypothetical protein
MADVIVEFCARWQMVEGATWLREQVVTGLPANARRNWR